MLFADVILPLAVERNYTYGIPIELHEKIKVGCRVEVQFGKRKIYSGIVKKIHQNKPDVYDVKPIRNLLDDEPIVTETQLKFWEWLASYYACTEGEVMSVALPSHIKLESETFLVLNPDIDINNVEVSDDEYMVLQALEIRQQQLLQQQNSQ